MKIKKNLTLISLMLGVMMLVGVMGMVSATTNTGSWTTSNGLNSGTWSETFGSGGEGHSGALLSATSSGGQWNLSGLTGQGAQIIASNVYSTQYTGGTFDLQSGLWGDAVHLNGIIATVIVNFGSSGNLLSSTLTFSAPDNGFTISASTNVTELTRNATGHNGTVSSAILTVKAAQTSVNLGTANDFAIVAESGITDARPAASTISGNIAIDPAAGSFITGVSCTSVTGTIYSSGGYTGGYNSNVLCAVTAPTIALATRSAMEVAYVDAAGRSSPDFIELGAGNIGGMTLAPGLYKWSTGLYIPTDVTLSGGANDVWIFQISGDLTMASAAKVLLIGGAQAKNIFWQVGGGVGVDIGTTAHVEGTILALKGINLKTSATLNGRALSQTLVTLDGNNVRAPVVVISNPTCYLTIDQPINGTFFDSQAVPIKWHLTEGCTTIDYFYISYKNLKDGPCSDLDHGWFNVTWGTNGEFGNNPYNYSWNRPLESGQYCIKVKVTSNGARDASGVFNVDLAPPVVNLTVGTPQSGDCTEGTGTCYVNNKTQINLTCNDNNPPALWQSGPDRIQYQINDGPVQTGYGNLTTFRFQQDSNHHVDYWCYDKVGKESLHKTKNFAVNSVVPIITKTVGDPKLSGCNSVWTPCDFYVNTNTKICLSATSGNPEHPVSGNIVLNCEYTWWATNPQGEQTGGQKVIIVLDSNGCFSYGQDSWHELHCTATDALGNIANLYEADIVDAKAPTTTLSYVGPHYVSGNSQWIDTLSTVNLTAIDSQLHPVNGVTTFYRESIVVNSNYCYKTNTSVFGGLSGAWTQYLTPFGLAESCRAIEYYSVDALGNAESVKTEFVFSDHTAPKAIKEVGKPRVSVNDNPLENWYQNLEQKIEWKITQDTQIDISCKDQSPHASGMGDAEYSGIWYRVVLDGQYNDTSANWTFLRSDHKTVQFIENSEHLLEFYCVDNVNKTSAVDSELFKVEGKTFNLTIGDKWDLISVPYNLLSNNVADIFGDNNKIQSVWGYENGVWKVYYPNDSGASTLTEITPGYGYWVKTTDGTTVQIGGNEFNPATTLSSVDVNIGWNLVGKYGIGNKTPYCEFFALNGKVTSLVGYDSSSQNFIYFNNDNFLHGSLTTGKGYWLGLNSAGLYYPSTLC